MTPGERLIEFRENLAQELGETPSFGTLISRLREDRGLTNRADFARSVGIPRQNLEQFEKGQRKCRPEIAEKIAVRLGVCPDELSLIAMDEQLAKLDVDVIQRIKKDGKYFYEFKTVE